VVDLPEQILERARAAIATVPDPEIPNLSIVDLGIVRSIRAHEGEIVVTITPTYFGCPAMQVIEKEITSALLAAGINSFRVEKVIAPPWTTGWITETGNQKLADAGIAPPMTKEHDSPVTMEFDETQVVCPLCGSKATSRVSQFGSTACKALYRCKSCLSPFEYFKPI
jgi:ring-1,2-phenylacetyl-CoA epoxidase subunit PaaD